MTFAFRSLNAFCSRVVSVAAELRKFTGLQRLNFVKGFTTRTGHNSGIDGDDKSIEPLFISFILPILAKALF